MIKGFSFSSGFLCGHLRAYEITAVNIRRGRKRGKCFPGGTAKARMGTGAGKSWGWILVLLLSRPEPSGKGLYFSEHQFPHLCNGQVGLGDDGRPEQDDIFQTGLAHMRCSVSASRTPPSSPFCRWNHWGARRGDDLPTQSGLHPRSALSHFWSQEQEATSFLSSSSLWAKAIKEKSIQDTETQCGFRSYLGQNPSLATLENLKLRLGRAGSNFLPFFLIIRSKSKKKKSIQDTETQCGFGPYRGRMNPKAKSTALYTRTYMAPNRVDIQ